MKHKSAVKSYRDVQQEVTDAIVRMIENGFDDDGRWQRPWRTLPGMPGLVPQSINGRSYRGLNVPILLAKANREGWTSNLWGTYKAWKEVGAQVEKGQRGTLVILWKFQKYEDKATGQEKTVPFVRGFTVFAAEQVRGFDLETWKADRIAKLPSEPERIASAEGLVARYSTEDHCPIEYGGDRAFYSPHFDQIQMPERAAFKDPHGFYGTLLHEMTHSTGHKKRLDRDFSGRFGDRAYAFEELVAELGSAMLCATLGICDEPRADHAKYVKSWLRVLKGDKRAIFTAAAKAQAATDYLVEFAGTSAEQELLAKLEEAA